jgi:hypothetical protein
MNSPNRLQFICDNCSPRAKVICCDNQDTVIHTATSENPHTLRSEGILHTELVGTKQRSKPITMPTKLEEYNYFCTVHRIDNISTPEPNISALDEEK